jgi:diguanylate cyclase (GGDEF)-like protein
VSPSCARSIPTTGRRRSFFLEAVKTGEVSSPVRSRVRHNDGSWRYVETIYKNLADDPNVGGILLTTRDVSDRKELEDQLAHRAFHDALTGLPKRSLFTDRVEHALARRLREAGRIAVLFLDVDDFKTVNDSLGHAAGDDLLVAIAKRIDECLRGGDTAARLGGDEFAILLEDVADQAEAGGVADRVIEALRPPFDIDGKRTFVYASIGIATSSGTPGERAEELLRNADVAMYIAKRRGKGGHEFFEPDMHLAALKRLELKAELEHALERDESWSTTSRPSIWPAAGSPPWSARALEPSRAGPGAALRLHPARRGDGADRPDRRLGTARGLPSGARVAAGLSG